MRRLGAAFDRRFAFWCNCVPESTAFRQAIWEMDGQIRRLTEAGVTYKEIERRFRLGRGTVFYICHKRRRSSPVERYFNERIDLNRLSSRSNTMKTKRLVKPPGLWGVDAEIRDLPLFQKLGDIPAIEQPTIVSVHKKPAKATVDPNKSYDEVNWAKLSPTYRAAHNRLRQSRGQAQIPDPEVDLYVKPPPSIRPFDPRDREVVAAGRQFLGPPLMGQRGDEGFTINGKPAKI